METNKTKNIILAVVIVVIIGGIWYLQSGKVSPTETTKGAPIALTDIETNQTVEATSTSTVVVAPKISSAQRKAQKAKLYQPAKEIVPGGSFINTDKFALKDLIGKKVILLDFWTYSCINCLRTLPYLNSWYSKYKDQGFVIVGVHTPEFDFEKDLANVTKATVDLGVKYPVVQDNDYGTWKTYLNNYWPHEYLIDIDGYIVHEKIGEGGYDETEKKIQELLAERAEVLGLKAMASVPITAPKQDNIQSQSPETYFGASRNELLVTDRPGIKGDQSFAEPVSVLLNKLYLIGKWNIQSEYAETSSDVGTGQVGSDRIDYRYKAMKVFLVAGAPAGKSIDIEVLLDSKSIDFTKKGKDIFYKSGKSYIKVEGNRLYSIIEDTAMGEHLLELIISNPGLQAYTFTFG